jgi:hypothetical protein
LTVDQYTASLERKVLGLGRNLRQHQRKRSITGALTMSETITIAELELGLASSQRAFADSPSEVELWFAGLTLEICSIRGNCAEFILRDPAVANGRCGWRWEIPGDPAEDDPDDPVEIPWGEQLWIDLMEDLFDSSDALLKPAINSITWFGASVGPEQEHAVEVKQPEMRPVPSCGADSKAVCRPS